MLGHPYKREETPFGRLIVKRTPEQDGSETIELECGHISKYATRQIDYHDEMPCPTCVNDYVVKEQAKQV